MGIVRVSGRGQFVRTRMCTGDLALSRRGCIFTMADRYQDRPFPADDDYDRGTTRTRRRVESDPLAELARLIGQTDPFGGRAKRRRIRCSPAQPMRRPQYAAAAHTRRRRMKTSAPRRSAALDAARPAGSRSRPAPQELSKSYESRRIPAEPGASAAPLCGASTCGNRHEPEYRERSAVTPEPSRQPDPSRYDDALYGQIESGEQDFQRDPAYPDDPLRLSERLRRGRAGSRASAAA